jgi:hypothetical protein
MCFTPRIVHLDQILPMASTRVMYDQTVAGFLALRDTWAACPRFHKEVTEWLYVYQAMWVCAFPLWSSSGRADRSSRKC